jgi:hypothetical protein
MQIDLSEIVDKKSYDPEEAMINVFFICSLMKNTPEVADMVLNTDPQDFLYQPRHSEAWKDFADSYEIVDFDGLGVKSGFFGSKDVKDTLKEFLDWVLTAKATVSKNQKEESNFFKLWNTVTYGTVYMFSKSSRTRQ